MERIPVTFNHKGKQYTGELSKVAGAGSNNTWHLMISNRFYGRLRYTDRWVFDSNYMPEIAEILGRLVDERNQ